MSSCYVKVQMMSYFMVEPHIRREAKSEVSEVDVPCSVSYVYLKVLKYTHVTCLHKIHKITCKHIISHDVYM